MKSKTESLLCISTCNVIFVENLSIGEMKLRVNDILSYIHRWNCFINSNI